MLKLGRRKLSGLFSRDKGGQSHEKTKPARLRYATAGRLCLEEGNGRNRHAGTLRLSGKEKVKPAIVSLKAIRDQAPADAERAAAMLESSGQQAFTPAMVCKFARAARERIRIDGGGYRRDHLRALAQRVEVADHEVRIIGSKSNLLHTLTAAAGVRSSV